MNFRTPFGKGREQQREIAQLRTKIEKLEKGGSVPLSKLKTIYMRAEKNARMDYEAAKTNRVRADWSTTRYTPYDQIKDDLPKIIARSRYAFGNDPIFRSAINVITNNAICTGMRPKSVVKNSEGQMVEGINKALDKGWQRYNDEWDRRGMMTFYEAERLALRTCALSGGVLTNLVRSTSGSLLPIAKQMLEPDRLDGSHDSQFITLDANLPHKQTLHGINLDAFGMPVSYWIRGVPQPIPSININHSFIHERPEQHIGVPWGAPALDSVWDVHQLLEDYMVKSRAIADVVWWVKDTADPFNAEEDKDDDDNGILESLSYLKTPEKPEVLSADDNVTESLKPLVAMIIHHISASLGTSYMTVTRDMENVNFAASRSNVVEERRFYRSLQKWFAKSFCQREWMDYVWWMVFTDQVPGLTVRRFLADQHKYTQAWWMAEGWDWVDPSKDSRAAIELRDAGLASDKSTLGAKGIDLEDHYQQLQIEKQMRKDFGIDDMFKTDQVAAPASSSSSDDSKDDNDEDQE